MIKGKTSIKSKKKKHQQPIPQENDWLYASPSKLSARTIIARLGMNNPILTELSTQGWENERQVSDDLLRAYKYPVIDRSGRKDRVSWDALDDNLIGHWLSGEDKLREELLLLRGCREEIVKNLARAVSAVEHYKYRIKELQIHRGGKPVEPPKKLLVLEGWDRPTMILKAGRYYVALIVNPLPQQKEEEVPLVGL